jgi:hypothetical protein
MHRLGCDFLEQAKAADRGRCELHKASPGLTRPATEGGHQPAQQQQQIQPKDDDDAIP